MKELKEIKGNMFTCFFTRPARLRRGSDYVWGHFQRAMFLGWCERDGIQLSACLPTPPHTRSDTSSSVFSTHLHDTRPPRSPSDVGVYAAAGAKMNQKWLTCCLCIIKQALLTAAVVISIFHGSQCDSSSMRAGNGFHTYHRRCRNHYFGHNST